VQDLPNCWLAKGRAKKRQKEKRLFEKVVFLDIQTVFLPDI